MERLDDGSAQDIGCPSFPCHHPNQSCTFCFCPFYPCLDRDLGRFIDGSKGRVWDCSACAWIHRPSVARVLADRLSGREGWEDLNELRVSMETSFPKSGKSLMILGTTSNSGKSLMVAALCRILHGEGYSVSPFKGQNMSLNSAVTSRGEEISRAQVLQAMAAGTEPVGEMNPILLKPKGGTTSQVILNGRPHQDMKVDRYYWEFALGEGIESIRTSFRRLQRWHDAVMIEGAGSPAEINIADREIANMRTARVTGSPCLLVVNIDWGGAFAHILGTLELMEPEDRRLVKGVIINNMRGDPTLLDSGIEKIERRTGVPVLGVVPHLDLYLPEEDSMGLRDQGDGSARIGVVRLPHISNYTDLDPLVLEKEVSIRYVSEPRDLDGLDALVIPGTKNSVSDLEWMRRVGLCRAIKEMGAIPVLGICGGYQIMGREIIDSEGVEGERGDVHEALGLLDVVTTFRDHSKTTVRVRGRLIAGEGGEVEGYEIHMGETVNRGEDPLFVLGEGKDGREEGAISSDGRYIGTYLHGLFEQPAFRHHFLSIMGLGSREVDHAKEVEGSLNSLAEAVKRSVDIGAVKRIMGLEERLDW
ncbi:MAG: cobyric acid synthase [Methanomassiliicoccales archaeon]